MRVVFSELPWIRRKVLDDISRYIIEHGRSSFHAKGSVIIEGGTYYSKMSIIHKGLLSKAVYNNSVNKHTAYSLLIPESMLGTSYFMSGRRANLVVTALRDTMLISVSHDDFRNKMAGDAHFMKNSLLQFANDIESDLEGLVALSFFSPEDKLKIFFKGLMLSYHMPMDMEWLSLPINLTYEEMAKVIYTTRVTVIRIINAWKTVGKYRKDGKERLIRHDLFDTLYDWTQK